MECHEEQGFRTDPSPPPQCSVTSLPAWIDEGRTVNAIRDWARADAASDAQMRIVLVKYIAVVV